MRKADYQTLARIIAGHLSVLRPLQDGKDPASNHLRALAHEFADTASVNKTEFLKACGIG